jgi:hypothetical protein
LRVGRLGVALLGRKSFLVIQNPLAMICGHTAHLKSQSPRVDSSMLEQPTLPWHGADERCPKWKGTGGDVYYLHVRPSRPPSRAKPAQTVSLHEPRIVQQSLRRPITRGDLPAEG